MRRVEVLGTLEWPHGVAPELRKDMSGSGVESESESES